MIFLILTDWVDDTPFVVNASHIVRMKRCATPKTDIVLSDGDSVLVTETPTQVLEMLVTKKRVPEVTLFDNLESDHLDKLEPIVRSRNV